MPEPVFTGAVRAPVAELPPGSVAVDYLGADPRFGADANIIVPAFSFHSDPADFCAYLARHGDWGRVDTGSVPASERGERQGNGVLLVGDNRGSSAADAAGPQLLHVDWRGGSLAELNVAMSGAGVSFALHNDILICAGGDDVAVVNMPPFSLESLDEMLKGQFVRVGAALVLFGAAADVAADRALLDRVSRLPSAGLLSYIALPSGADTDFLEKWLTEAGYDGDYTMSGGYIFGQHYVIAYVRRLMDSLGAEQCAHFEWELRGVDSDELLELLSVFPDDSLLCAGADWKVFARRGLISARVFSARVREVRAYLERHDPAPRPVVVDGMMIVAAGEDAAALDYQLERYTGGNLQHLSGGISINADVSDLSGRLGVNWRRSASSSVYRFSIPGMLGDELAVNQGQSVNIAAGAVVDQAGNTRQSVSRTQVGLNCTFTATRRAGGFAVDYSVAVSSLAADADVVNQISRAGKVYVGRGESVVVLHLEVNAGTAGGGLISWSRGFSQNRVYLLFSVREGYLSGVVIDE